MQFHAAYQRITQFVSVELSAVYHDTVKDRLYTSPAIAAAPIHSDRAIGIQSFTKMLSPMLVFTADEAWEAIPHLDSGSVHLADWEPFEFSISADEAANWQTLFAIRTRPAGAGRGSAGQAHRQGARGLCDSRRNW